MSDYRIKIYGESMDGELRYLGTCNTDNPRRAAEMYEDELRDDERVVWTLQSASSGNVLMRTYTHSRQQTAGDTMTTINSMRNGDEVDRDIMAALDSAHRPRGCRTDEAVDADMEWISALAPISDGSFVQDNAFIGIERL